MYNFMVEVCSKISRPGILYNLIGQLHVGMVDAIFWVYLSVTMVKYLARTLKVLQ